MLLLHSTTKVDQVTPTLSLLHYQTGCTHQDCGCCYGSSSPAKGYAWSSEHSRFCEEFRQIYKVLNIVLHTIFKVTNLRF